MPVRFKFRSSVDYDTVDIGCQPSISVRDLRFKILQQKNLKICNDFELVISDADTGDEFDDEDSMVLDGMNVIIKRVPAGRSAALDPPHVSAIGSTNAMGSSPTTNVDMDNFDDFGVDLYPAPEACSSDLNTGNDKINCTEKANDARCSEQSISRSQNIEPSIGVEGISRGNSKKDYVVNCHAGSKLQPKLQHKVEDNKKLDVNTTTPIPNAELPAELRCSLCNAIFMEAVMIPCCQHSFCDKCIRSVLLEKEKCPRCSSTKCRVDDLLPNVSLRQAIEHFLESQVLISGSDNILPKYAPDGESGIQAKEPSCAMSIFQQEPPLPHSPSATGKGSNQVTPESAYESGTRNSGLPGGNGSRIIHLNSGKSAKLMPSLHKIKSMQSWDEKDSAACNEGLKPAADLHGEASCKKKGLWVNTTDKNFAAFNNASGSFVPMTRSKKIDMNNNLLQEFSLENMTLLQEFLLLEKGERNCYMCGSPDHLVRDCPAASSSYPVLHTDGMFPGGMSGYGPHYWQGSSFPHVRSFTNLYGTPGMMPFDPTMVPLSPFGVPPYVPSMYAGMPVPLFMRMGGVMPPPVITGVERPLSRAEFMELQERDRRHKLPNDHTHRHDEPQRRSRDNRAQSDREIIRTDSDNSENWRSRKKHLHGKQSDSFSHQRSGFVSDEDTCSVECKHDKGSHFSTSGRENSKAYYAERLNLEAQDMPGSSSHCSREKHKRHQTSSSKKRDMNNEHCGSESRRKNHHRCWKEVSDEREETDVKKHSRQHSSHSTAGLSAPSSTGDRKQQRKEGISHHSSKRSKHKEAKADGDLENDRWELVDGLNDEDQSDHNYHKHKRNH